MKWRVWICLALSLSFILSGCQAVPQTGQEQLDTAVSDQQIPDDEPDAGYTEQDRAALTAVLGQIRAEAQFGTAGSAMTSVRLAAVLLDWGMETPMTVEEIIEGTQGWFEELESNDQEEFLVQISGVEDAISQVTAENGADLLETVGCTESGYPWNEAAQIAAETVANAILPEGFSPET